MSKIFSTMQALIFTFAFAPMAMAEVLQMPDPAAQSEAEAAYTVEMPARGMTKNKVEELFGSPAQKLDEVGTPPISSWIYRDFTVYFESEYVLHAVLTKGVPAPQ